MGAPDRAKVIKLIVFHGVTFGFGASLASIGRLPILPALEKALLHHLPESSASGFKVPASSSTSSAVSSLASASPWHGQLQPWQDHP